MRSGSSSRWIGSKKSSIGLILDENPRIRNPPTALRNELMAASLVKRSSSRLGRNARKLVFSPNAARRVAIRDLPYGVLTTLIASKK